MFRYATLQKIFIVQGFTQGKIKKQTKKYENCTNEQCVTIV